MRVKDSDDASGTQPITPISVYLLYSSSIYARRLAALMQSMIAEPGLTFRLPDNTTNSIAALLRTIALYRNHSLIELEKDSLVILLERKFRGLDRYGNVLRFSPEWWSFLNSSLEHSSQHLKRFKPTWYEDMFHDQLKRLTTNTYTTPLMTLQKTPVVNNQRDASAQSDSLTSMDNYTLQILPSI